MPGDATLEGHHVRSARIAGATVGLLAFALVAASSASAAVTFGRATVTLAEVSKYYADLVQHPAPLREYMEEDLGPLPDAVWAAIALPSLELLREPEFAPYALAEIGPLLDRGGSIENLLLWAARPGRLGAIGVTRLPDDGLETMFQMFLDAVSWLGDNGACAPLAAPGGGAAEDFEGALALSGLRVEQFLIDAGPDYVERIFTVLTDAAIAEVNDTPPRVEPPDTEAINAAVIAYWTAVYSRIQSLPNPGEFLVALQAGPAAPPALMCDFMEMAFTAILDLPAEHRSVVILDILALLNPESDRPSIIFGGG